jgi:hypothetical protein
VIILKPTGRVPFLVLVGITLFLGMVMLYFGIRFRGYRPTNNIEWLPASEGLCFKRFAIAYTDDFFPPSDAAGKDAGLTIEIAFRSLDLTSGNYGYLLSVYAGDDRSQLLIGQWRHWILIMNGADHDGRLGTRKVAVDISGSEGHTNLLTITSGRKGTSVYLDGKLAKTDPKLQLSYPYQAGRTWLTLGNSLYGHHPWHGLLAGLALYDIAIDPEEVMEHEAQWAAGSFAGINGGIAPKIRYRFDLHATGQVNNIAGKDYPLHVPEWMVILKKEILSWRQVLNRMKWNIAQDMVINLLGFMPLGWMLCATLSRLGGFAGRRYLWLAVGLAFAFSLSLEIVQAWIPSRDSSLIDLIMNTLGAAAGSWIYSVGWLHRFVD